MSVGGLKLALAREQIFFCNPPTGAYGLIIFTLT